MARGHSISRFAFGTILVGSIGVVAASTEAAPTTAPLAVEAVLAAPALAAYSPPSFSPDSRLLAYVVTDNGRRRAGMDRYDLLRAGVPWYGVAADIWITDLESGESRRLTGGEDNAWAPAWSPDGSRLAFLSARNEGTALGPARLWVWERTADELRQVGEADLRECHSGLLWTAGGELLVELFAEDLPREKLAAEMSGKPPAAAPEANAGAATVRLYEFDPAVPGAVPQGDQINLDYWRKDLALIDVASGQPRRILTGARIGYYALSPDRRRLAVAHLVGSEKPGSGQYLYDLSVGDLAAGTPRALAARIRLSLIGSPFVWSPRGDHLAWRTSGPLARDEVYVQPVDGGASRRVSEGPPISELDEEPAPPVWTDAGNDVYYRRGGELWRAATDGSGARRLAGDEALRLELVAPRRERLLSLDGGKSAIVFTSNPSTKRVGLARVDLSTGALTQIFDEDKKYGGYGVESAVLPDGRSVLYVAEDAHHPADLWLLSGDLQQPRQVSRVAPALSGIELGSARIVEWRSLDGEILRGALVTPAGYEPGKRYPLVVEVYGGSDISGHLNNFGYAIAPVENRQLFSTRGYALLLADSKIQLGTPMADLMKSVMPGIDKVIELGVADPERLGIMGHSYGGYSTLALIAQSSRFRAAVMRAGFGNLFSAYGQLAPDGTNYGLNWAESGQGRMGGTPWEFRERYLENSPYFWLDRVSTPLLIVHGAEDDAVPAYLADEIFTGLRRLGKTVSYAKYGGEDHWEGGWSYANQVDYLDRVLAWFERYLKQAPVPAPPR